VTRPIALALWVTESHICRTVPHELKLSVERRDHRAIGDDHKIVVLGATRFQVTWINAAGDEEKVRRDVMLVALSRNVPALLDDAARNRMNFIAGTAPCMAWRRRRF
jgi:hypothetical protein